MENKKITVCLRNFNLSRVIFLQGPDMPGGGLLEALAKSAGQQDQKAPVPSNSPKPEPADHRQFKGMPDDKFDATLNKDLGPMEDFTAQQAMPGGGKIGGITNSLRNGLQGLLRKIPFVGNTIAHPRRAIQGLVDGVFHPGQTIKKAFHKLKPSRFPGRPLSKFRKK